MCRANPRAHVESGLLGKAVVDGLGSFRLAAELYDEILFNGATFGDLDRGTGPLILTSATDITTGSRFEFTQRIFDIICSDLNAVPQSRAAAASSAVPVVLSAVTINNYGGTCNKSRPLGRSRPSTPRTRHDPPRGRYVHSKQRKPTATAFIGPISISSTAASRTTWACAACSLRWKSFEALQETGVPTRLDTARRVVVFMVNSLSAPPTKWDESEELSGTVDILQSGRHSGSTIIPMSH